MTAVVINKIPTVATILRKGTRASSRDLPEMATVNRFSPWARVRHLVLPEVAPYFAAAAWNGLVLARKIVLVVELLGEPKGVGFQLDVYFQLFGVATILTYAIGFIVVVQAIEILLLDPWQRRGTRWWR